MAVFSLYRELVVLMIMLRSVYRELVVLMIMLRSRWQYFVYTESW